MSGNKFETQNTAATFFKFVTHDLGKDAIEKP